MYTKNLYGHIFFVNGDVPPEFLDCSAFKREVVEILALYHRHYFMMMCGEYDGRVLSMYPLHQDDRERFLLKESSRENPRKNWKIEITIICDVIGPN